MPFNLRHASVSKKFEPVTNETAGGTFFTVDERGEFEVLYPGRLDRVVSATVRHRIRVQVTTEGIPLTLLIFAPDGAQFTKNEVALEDFAKYRDLRGTPLGPWRYTLSGRSKTYQLTDALSEAVYHPTGVIEIATCETVRSESAGPLIANEQLNGLRQELTFDLHRAGEFVAEIAHSSPIDPWRGSMSLIDPDGKRIASSTRRTLRCDIPVAALGASRGAGDAPRKWSLQVLPQGGTVAGEPRISATVLDAGRIGTSVLHERVNSLIGPNGSFIDLAGDNKDGHATARLTIKDVTAAETIDMFGVLDNLLEKAGTSTDLAAHQPCTLYSTEESLDYGLRLDVSSIRLKSIGVAVGPGKGLGADVPVVKLTLAAQGSVKVKWSSFTLADAKLRDGQATIEVGIKLDADGCPRIATWVSDDPFDVDLSTTVIAALIGASSVVGGVTAAAIAEYVEHIVNDQIVAGARELFADPALAPKILMMIFGAHLTYRRIRFDGTDIAFEHVAPAEPGPKPRKGYAGAIGRAVSIEGSNFARCLPPTLGDTWAADKLASKIRPEPRAATAFGSGFFRGVASIEAAVGGVPAIDVLAGDR